MSVRPVQHPPSLVEEDQEHSSQIMHHFSLAGLFPEGQTLVFNAELGTLSLLVIEQERPYQLVEQQFTPTQLALLMPLLESYPYYCPHETILASFARGYPLSEKIIAHYRHRLHEACLAGMWDQEMRPVRNVLSRLRFKLRFFGLNMHPILETGYLLIREPRGMIMQKPEHPSSDHHRAGSLLVVGSEGTHESEAARRAAEGATPAIDRSQARPAMVAARIS